MHSTENKICDTCGCWSKPATEDRGECRALPPTITGWPNTTANDWCISGWVHDTRLTHDRLPMLAPGRVGFNYAYIRDYAEDACTWLESAIENPKEIPSAFRHVLANPLNNEVTELFPILSEEGEDCEAILQWAGALPGSDNNALEDDAWMGILCYLEETVVRQENEAIRASLCDNHPWIVLCKKVCSLATITA